MHPQYPWTTHALGTTDKVGLISIGSIEDKIPLILYPLLLLSDIELGLYKSFGYPREISLELIRKIDGLINKQDVKNVVFDIRIQRRANTSWHKRSRLLSQQLQRSCDELKVNTSIILSNGSHFIGNALGIPSEMEEASDSINGEGPQDLTKFALEIGADFLMLTKKSDLRIEAKKMLRDKMLRGKISSTSPCIMKKWNFLSLKTGYIHNLDLDRLRAWRSDLFKEGTGIGISLKKKPGDRVEKGEILIEFYIPRGQKYMPERESCQRVFFITPDPPRFQPFIFERLGLTIHS